MPVVRSSAWFAHSEPIITTLLCSKKKDEREFAINMIKSVRGDNELGDKSVRPRVHPYLKINATNLTDLIDWDGATEPIITCQITTAELEKFRESPLEVEYFPCQTQMIERAVKEVTAAAGAVCGAE